MKFPLTMLLIASLPAVAFDRDDPWSWERPNDRRYVCTSSYTIADPDNGVERSTFPTACAEALAAQRRGVFCRGNELVRIWDGTAVSTFPLNCADSLAGARYGHFCTGTHRLTDLRAGAGGGLSTFPIECAKALAAAQRGSICVGSYKLRSLRSGREVDTFPTNCEEVLRP